MDFMFAKIYTESDATLSVLNSKTIAILGYGSQGHAHALNLKDNGQKVIIGLHRKSRSIGIAIKHGFQVFSIDDAVKKSDIVLIAVPDMVHSSLYHDFIAPHLKIGKTLLFLHGLSVHYKLIEIPKVINVALVAPKGPGHLVRTQYIEGKGVPSLIAIKSDPSGNTRDICLAWAKGIGSTRCGVIETTFCEEVETDLFGEQAVLCGGLSSLIRAGYETLVEAGYKSEMAYFECLHEIKFIIDLIVESGISGMRFSISDTAEYGDYISGPRIINEESKKSMNTLLRDIKNKTFIKNWIAEYKTDCLNLKKKRKAYSQHTIESIGQKLRAIMPWIPKRNINGAQAEYI